MKRLGLITLRAVILVCVGFLLYDTACGGPMVLEAILAATGIVCFVATFVDFTDAPLF